MRRAMQRCWSLLLLILLAGCPASEEGDEPACGEAEVDCSGVCVDLRSDAAHCGKCGTACAEGERCAAGLCVPDCPGEQEACDGVCVDLASDPKNCGACGTACEEGFVCSKGGCQPGCEDGKQACDGACVDTDADARHCGGCGNSCAEGAACVSGNCVCSGEGQVCGGVCVDTDSDVSHCGACDNACGATQVCSKGNCTCPAGMTQCGEACTDTSKDPEACGSCENSCLEKANVSFGFCDAGQCHLTCEADFRDCNEDPADGCEVKIVDNPDHCGACGIACADLPNIVSTSGCSEGKCEFTCDKVNYDNCDGNPATGCEADLKKGVTHCGNCGTNCTALANVGEVECDEGQCVLLSCAEGFENCDGKLENGCEIEIAGDPDNCGACGRVCEIGCFQGECVEVVQVVAGELHTCALLSNGEVWCWGENDDDSFPLPSTERGQLGNGTTHPSPTPVRVLNVEDAVQISAGRHSTCAVTAEGALWCWGDNAAGLLGDGSRLNYHATPVRAGLTDVVQVAVGGHHACARTRQKEVWCWGAEYDGRLGNGQHSEDYVLVPEKIPDFGDIEDLAAGNFHTCAIDSGGAAWCWGSNTFGQIGSGSWDSRFLVPTKVKDLGPASRLSAGKDHSCALLRNGEVWCWGSGMFGSLGDGSSFPMDSEVPVRAQDLQDVVDIALGGDGSCAVTEAGKLYCWGTAASGGDGPGGPGPKPGPGPGGGGTAPEEVADVADAAKVGAGPNHRCFITKEGALRCWGDNSRGQLGDGTTASKSEPVPVSW